LLVRFFTNKAFTLKSSKMYSVIRKRHLNPFLSNFQFLTVCQFPFSASLRGLFKRSIITITEKWPCILSIIRRILILGFWTSN
jgi:hypothetical protein